MYFYFCLSAVAVIVVEVCCAGCACFVGVVGWCVPGDALFRMWGVTVKELIIFGLVHTV
ncbi:hypothetical protein G7Y31_05475 [Corynebacterium lizhenjunii]|uniref:Uncharacterized protein n=1 Tax=Corynebacterium lizhenjunii TaxID=2709394 RepID=A0A7T0KDM8_9CORY|nr:hypothetical protein [Corynebacterium lizhenjunii]QPK78863.1 hypothetical protein G7Y31_10085 [Corynebacterium lizhenjunii]QPK80135.1 hypothetical protein G7Y31_05475 [Corynebacterium lizhenjunii]